MKLAAALAALGLALLAGCAPAESALSQVEPIVQESEAPSREGGEVSMAQESGPFTTDTPIEDVKRGLWQIAVPGGGLVYQRHYVRRIATDLVQQHRPG